MLYLPPASPSLPRPCPHQAILDQVTAVEEQLLSRISLLLSLASRTAILPLYLTVKGVVCCTAADDIADVWRVLTVCGWVMLVSWVAGWVAGSCW